MIVALQYPNVSKIKEQGKHLSCLIQRLHYESEHFVIGVYTYGLGVKMVGLKLGTLPTARCDYTLPYIYKSSLTNVRTSPEVRVFEAA